jgi:hypothetical protein
MITISMEALKAMLLINGGSIVALLAFLGQSHNGPQLAAHLQCPITAFVIGVITSAMAFVSSYVTQFVLYNEPPVRGECKWPPHMNAVVITVGLVCVSIAAFSVGAFGSISALASSGPN